MKKMNVFNLIAIASLCATVLQGAVPPAESTEERMAREQVRAYQEARGATLAEPVPEIIQEYLKAHKIPIKIINNSRKPITYRVSIEDAQTGQKITDVDVRTYQYNVPGRPIELVHEEKAFAAPLIPLRVMVYHVVGTDGDLRGSFELSMQELNNIESIQITHSHATIIDKNKQTHDKHFVDPIPFHYE